MTPTVRSPLKWIGGKYMAAPTIVRAFPPAHRYHTYLEPCGGAAHVLFYKPAWGHREVYNDLNNDLYNFWCQMQLHADEMAERLQALPYSRALYYAFYQRLFDGSQIEPLERAVMWFYVLRSTGTGWIRLSPVGWNNSEGSAAAYRSVLDTFAAVQARLTQTALIIDNRDVERVIEEYDSPTTLHYVDPPYIGAEYYYQAGIRTHSRAVFDHQRLAQILNRVQGMVALSYYPHQQLDTWYPPDRWRRISWQQHKPSALAEGADARIATELLLCNYEAPIHSTLWESEALAEEEEVQYV
jgi:DNA adenine methylase